MTMETKWKLSAKAKKILLQAAWDIITHPELYDQSLDIVPTCSTEGCIYGFIASRHPKTIISGEWLNGTYRVRFDAVSKLLGFGEYSEGQWIGEPGKLIPGGRLFYHWPKEYSMLLEIAEAKRDRFQAALVAVSRIRHFIRTGL